MKICPAKEDFNSFVFVFSAKGSIALLISKA